jgi:hypothetical protein
MLPQKKDHEEKPKAHTRVPFVFWKAPSYFNLGSRLGFFKINVTAFPMTSPQQSPVRFGSN